MDTRELILDAAASVIRHRGMAKTTTREIAREAGYSEATLYKHFTGKAELLVSVLRERSPAMAQLTRAMDSDDDDLVEGLTAIAGAAIAFYTDSFPMLASIFSEPTILAAHTAGLRLVGAGPQRVNEAVVEYLRRHQTLGVVSADADLDGAAGLLVGACFQHAFLGHMNWSERRTDERAASAFAALVATTLR
ncbi:TetR family transcriptional regulator [Asanoa ishikariensis]|uniref:Transcriptional regulator, TetR family n=1 Tax=Asanoa ishikariensis TaxID=137265 RepID=A0A1H3QNI1_9ACTN|nr:TetR/AcrR family transcriptional regulator [Asanoa ishikariensis]GIF64835.1 TetR family transcriptional regulator [Asanoa ishikariensis]SDZ15122.1 transcriptional regulator, TetR family [Asanoa ishikariensis]